MSQKDPRAFVDTESGSQLASRLNDTAGALASQHKGSTAPSYAEAGLIWLDDSAATWPLKIYDGTDWIEIGTLDPTANSFALKVHTDIDMLGKVLTNVKRIEDEDGDTFLAVESTADLDDVQVGCEGNVVATFSADVPLTTTHANVSDLIALLQATDGNYAGQGLKVKTTRPGNAAFNLAMFVSNNDADVEFRFTGHGNGECDGSWTGGGAGYAEAFEWVDGNPDAEDRVGLTVVIVPDTDTIRPAVAGEDPDGVITGRPTVVGRSAPMRWDGKYLRDAYGRPVLDDNGDRVPNPDFDGSREYTPRHERKEWGLVSLLGLEPVRDGQPVSKRWTRAGKGDGVTRYVIR